MISVEDLKLQNRIAKIPSISHKLITALFCINLGKSSINFKAQGQHELEVVTATTSKFRQLLQRSQRDYHSASVEPYGEFSLWNLQ